MSELNIKTHDFEEAKQRIKEFSEKKVGELKLQHVESGSWFFGLGDHWVTGKELNDRISIIQKYFIHLDNTNIKTIKEFGDIYKALESLDKDYIQAIVASIKSIEETNENVKNVQEYQKKTIEQLKKFKQKLDNYSHLEDIDKIWDDSKRLYEEVTALHHSIENKINNLQEEFENLNNRICKHQSDMETFIQTNNDTIANIIEKNDKNIKNLTKKIKYTYMFTSGVLGIALIELIIIILKVI